LLTTTRKLHDKYYNSIDQLVISKENTKLGRIPNISLPPIISCQKNVECASSGCYSFKHYKRFDSVKAARWHNWFIWEENPDTYFEQLDEFISKKKPLYFRFHVDGDIPNNDYYKRMIAIAKRHPRTRFLAFTKNYSLDLQIRTENLVILPSSWPTRKLPENIIEQHEIAWMQDGTETRISGPYYECHKHCDECYKCWHIYELKKGVVLQKH